MTAVAFKGPPQLVENRSGDQPPVLGEIPLPAEALATRGNSAIEAVTCDLWYTLIYPTPRVRAEIEEARRRVWAEALADAGCSPRRADTWARRIDGAAELAETSGWSPSWDERVQQWADRAGVALDAVRMSERFVASVPLRQVRVASGADQTLRRLRRQGLRLAIVSNATHEPPEAIRDVLSHHGLDRRFDTIVLSTDVGRAKPRREPFRRALAELGAAPGGTVHIGDSAADFQGAGAVGIRPLLFTGLQRWKPERLRNAHSPWMKGALQVGRWEDVPAVVSFYGALPPLPRVAPRRRS